MECDDGRRRDGAHGHWQTAWSDISVCGARAEPLSQARGWGGPVEEGVYAWR